MGKGKHPSPRVSDLEREEEQNLEETGQLAGGVSEGRGCEGLLRKGH